MPTWNVCARYILTVTLTLAVHIDCIPMQYDKVALHHHDAEIIVAKLNTKLSMVDTEARISRIFYNKNATIDESTFTEMPKQLYKMFLNTTGLGKVAEILPMSWIEVTSLEGPFLSETQRVLKCNELLHPDHLLSYVILENLIPAEDQAAAANMKGNVVEDLKQLFCNRDMKAVTLQYMQTDDVISGLAILGLGIDGSLFFFANIGF